MKRFLIVITLCLSTLCTTVHAQYYSVNYDVRTVAAMAAAFGTEVAAESYYNEQVAAILKHYTTAEVATAGIFASKYLERRALTDIGIWNNATENYYYRRIYKMVSEKIMPKIWVVARQMLRSPQNALYWGSYLVKICDEVKSLCMQFESVVTNSTLSFSDVAFLEIKSEIADILNLSTFAGINWQKFLDDLAKVSDNITVDKLKEDIDNLYAMGVGLARAGITNIGHTLLFNQSTISDAMNGKVDAIKELYDNYAELFEQIDQGLGATLLYLVGGEENVAGLFDLSDYNIASWMTDYLSEAKGNYYTQRWYIARRESGSTVLCDYTPPTDDESILSGGQWYRIETSDPDFYPSNAQRQQILANSESYAGWSRQRVLNLGGKEDGVSYSFNSSLFAYIISRGNKQTKKAYAYSIKVIKSWNREEIEYEDYFDSYSMDLNTFKAQLNARLTELNENEEGFTYFIGSDERNYYSASDVQKLQGCESVTISVTCSDNVVLGQGSTQYKCRSCGGTLTAHTRECAMSTTLTDNELDVSEIQAMIDEARREMKTIEAQIVDLEATNAALLKQIKTASSTTIPALQAKYNINKSKIVRLKSDLDTWKKKLEEYEAALAEAQNDDVPTDDYYRIPAIMQDCKTAYDLTWQGAGSWSAYTFIRKATIPDVNGVITFRATLNVARKPKYFLGIKIHRAIIQIKWELSSDFSQTTVAKVLTLDPEMSDEEKEKYVNSQINEVARQYPRCKVTTDYVKAEPLEDEEGKDVIHLLWASDRLDIAREVDSRITNIYSELVSLEKMLSYKRDILDVLKDIAPELNRDEGRKLNIVQQSQKRWMDNAKATGKR